MTIKEEIQIEEYKRTFAEAYKQGFIDAMSVCKTEPNLSEFPNSSDEPQTDTITFTYTEEEWNEIQDWKDRMWTEAMKSCGFNVDGYRQGQPKTEPQTERSE